MVKEIRREIVSARIDALARDFSRYVLAYDESVPFSSSQYEAHARTMRLRRSLGTATEAARDHDFLAHLRATLVEWRLDVRGSRLAPRDEFVAAFRARVDDIAGLDGLQIDDPSLDAATVSQRLWKLIDSLDIVRNQARLVATTKALHHVLPDLVVPMDRQWTGTFFGLHPPEWQDPDNQRRVLTRCFGHFASLARAVDPGRYVGAGWRTSKTKVLDNALIGFCKLEVVGHDRVRVAGPAEFSIQVAGFPPAKSEALSILGAGHPHAPRVAALLAATRDAMRATGFDGFGTDPLLLDVVVYAPKDRDPWDATNYLGGIADVLEEKSRRGPLDHLGELALVALYTNDRQIKQLAYRQEEADEPRYAVRLRSLT